MKTLFKVLFTVLTLLLCVGIFFKSVTLLNAPSDVWVVWGFTSLLLDGLVTYWILQLIWSKRVRSIQTNESIELQGNVVSRGK